MGKDISWLIGCIRNESGVVQVFERLQDESRTMLLRVQPPHLKHPLQIR